MTPTEESMQFALTRPGNLFDFRRYASVTNVSYGFLYSGEADLLCLSKSGTLHEVEIKISRSDILAEKRKRRPHQDPRVSFTWFAVPEPLAQDALSLLDERFGVVAVKEVTSKSGFTREFTSVERKPKKSPHLTRKPTPNEIIKLLRLGCIRFWSDGQSKIMLRRQLNAARRELYQLRGQP